jgi:hypothetical protein
VGLRHHLLLFDEDPERRRAVEATVGAYAVPMTVEVVPARDHALRRQYRARPPWLVLVRPDGHVGYAGRADDLAAFTAVLDRWATRPGNDRGPREELATPTHERTKAFWRRC